MSSSNDSSENLPIENGSDCGCGITIGLSKKVRIHHEGRDGICVAKSTTDRTYGNTFSKQACGSEVPEIVKPDRLKTHRFPDPNEPLGYLIRHPWSTAVRVEKKDMGRITKG